MTEESLEKGEKPSPSHCTFGKNFQQDVDLFLKNKQKNTHIFSTGLAKVLQNFRIAHYTFGKDVSQDYDPLKAYF